MNLSPLSIVRCVVAAFRVIAMTSFLGALLRQLWTPFHLSCLTIESITLTCSMIDGLTFPTVCVIVRQEVSMNGFSTEFLPRRVWFIQDENGKRVKVHARNYNEAFTMGFMIYPKQNFTAFPKTVCGITMYHE